MMAAEGAAPNLGLAHNKSYEWRGSLSSLLPSALDFPVMMAKTQREPRQGSAPFGLCSAAPLELVYGGAEW